MSISILKFSSEDCGTCHRMSHYDENVSNELDCNFISVVLQDTVTYKKYRKILLKQYPNKQGMGWPTYLVVKNVDDDFEIIGEVKGGMSKGDFRSRLSKIVSE